MSRSVREIANDVLPTKRRACGGNTDSESVYLQYSFMQFSCAHWMLSFATLHRRFTLYIRRRGCGITKTPSFVWGGLSEYIIIGSACSQLAKMLEAWGFVVQCTRHLQGHVKKQRMWSNLFDVLAYRAAVQRRLFDRMADLPFCMGCYFHVIIAFVTCYLQTAIKNFWCEMYVFRCCDSRWYPGVHSLMFDEGCSLRCTSYFWSRLRYY